MTLAQVKGFLAAAETGSMTQAAGRLGISQPALSEQVRNLERDLGVVLFERSKLGLRLTEVGTRFLPRARAVASAVADAESAISDVRDLREGSLSFGLFNSGMQVLSRLVPEFARRHPGISVRIAGANSAQVADLIRAGALEAGVVALPVDDSGLHLSDVVWSCEAAYFHRDALATARPLTIDDVVRRPLVLQEASYRETDPTRRQLSERAQTRGLQLRPDIEVESSAAALAIAASGVAGAIASIPVAEALGLDAVLHRASLDPPLIESFAVLSRDPKALSPATLAMLELVEEQMRELHAQQHTGLHIERHPG